MEKELSEIAKKIGYTIIDSPGTLLIKSKFNFFNRFHFGLIFLFFLGGIGVFLPLLNKANVIVSLILILMGLLLLISSILGIVFTATSYVSVSNEEIKFKHGWKKHHFKLNPSMRVKMKGRLEMHERSKGSPRTYYTWDIDIFLKNRDKEYKIIAFIVDEKYKTEANLLGREITRKIKSSISQFPKRA